jgi:hypothetical protein
MATGRTMNGMQSVNQGGKLQHADHCEIEPEMAARLAAVERPKVSSGPRTTSTLVRSDEQAAPTRQLAERAGVPDEKTRIAASAAIVSDNPR